MIRSQLIQTHLCKVHKQPVCDGLSLIALLWSTAHINTSCVPSLYDKFLSWPTGCRLVPVEEPHDSLHEASMESVHLCFRGPPRHPWRLEQRLPNRVQKPAPPWNWQSPPSHEHDERSLDEPRQPLEPFRDPAYAHSGRAAEYIDRNKRDARLERHSHEPLSVLEQDHLGSGAPLRPRTAHGCVQLL